MDMSVVDAPRPASTATTSPRASSGPTDPSDCISPQTTSRPPPQPSSADPNPAVSDNGRAIPCDLSALPADEALRLLSASLELLVCVTGDVPPTPPPPRHTDPQLSGLQAEKDRIVRRSSDMSLSQLQEQHRRGKLDEKEAPRSTAEDVADGKHPCDDDDDDARHHSHRDDQPRLQAHNATESVIPAGQVSLLNHDGETDDVEPRPQSNPTPSSAATPDTQPLNAQHGAMARKFYSRDEPPISLTRYLLRLQRFCPASAAVALAASLYIRRLAVEERAVAVTRRTVHRLALAALRVAAKALEDLPHPHARFARVGGVSAAELARLETAFCFLAGFELVVGERALSAHWKLLCEDEDRGRRCRGSREEEQENRVQGRGDGQHVPHHHQVRYQHQHQRHHQHVDAPPYHHQHYSNTGHDATLAATATPPLIMVTKPQEMRA